MTMIRALKAVRRAGLVHIVMKHVHPHVPTVHGILQYHVSLVSMAFSEQTAKKTAMAGVIKVTTKIRFAVKKMVIVYMGAKAATGEQLVICLAAMAVKTILVINRQEYVFSTARGHISVKTAIIHAVQIAELITKLHANVRLYQAVVTGDAYKVTMELTVQSRAARAVRIQYASNTTEPVNRDVLKELLVMTAW